MKKLIYLLLSLFIAITIVYALDYVESSSGLETPALDGGRTELEMADVDDDGNIDILSIGDHGSPYVNTDEHGVMVWFGDGQGNWSVYQYGDFGYGGIATGDINNDGYMDVAYGMHHNYADSGIDLGDSILEAALGDGSGQHWVAWDDGISTGGDWGMFATDLADINNDGLLDIGSVSFGADDGVHICINHGDGTWHHSFGYSGGNSTMFFQFGDVNADGNADFAVGHQYGSVYLGDGEGGFSLADGNLPPGGNMGRRGCSLGDVNNDGKQDFAYCNSDGGVEVWVWAGSNTWQDYSNALPATGPYSATQLCDMDLDNNIDVAAFGDSTVTIWLGDGAGTWIEATTFYTPGSGYLAAFYVRNDADHNGFPDIALVGEEGDTWNAINHLHFYKETSVAGSLFVHPVYPRGGETFFGGSVRFIEWTCGVPTGSNALIDLDVSYSGPAGPWNQIVMNTPNNCRYQWTIPTGVSSDNCYVRYTAATQNDTSVAVTPARFTILPVVSVQERAGKAMSECRVSVAPSVCGGNILVNITVTDVSQGTVNVYDQTGKLIKRLFKVNGSGMFNIQWDRTDNRNCVVSSGTYFITLESKGEVVTKKIVILD